MIPRGLAHKKKNQNVNNQKSNVKPLGSLRSHKYMFHMN